MRLKVKLKDVSNKGLTSCEYYYVEKYEFTKGGYLKLHFIENSPAYNAYGKTSIIRDIKKDNIESLKEIDKV